MEPRGLVDIVRAFRVAYDGRPFHGFQRQPDVPTVEGAIFQALGALDVVENEGDTPDGYAAAGRTDAGVSAVAQTVAFETPAWCSAAALNSELPADVRAWAVADVPPDFHATRDARSREYVYHLYAPPEEIDDRRVRAALDRLSGEHDFHNLTPDEENTVRKVRGSVEREGPFLLLRFVAGGFVRHLVRRTVTLVRGIGTGQSDLDHVDRVLHSDPLDGPEGIPPAPATPLVLTHVEYPDVTFAVDSDAVESAIEVFEQRRVDGRTRARVARAIVDRVS